MENNSIPFLIRNMWKTPDGTILESKYTHDYVSHTDTLTGEYFAVDGGLSYLRGSGDFKNLENLCIYSDAPFEVIRENLFRGSYGKNFDEPYRRVLLKDMDDDWLDNVIIYEEERNPKNPYLEFYRNEREYRSNE